MRLTVVVSPKDTLAVVELVANSLPEGGYAATVYVPASKPIIE